RRARAHTMYVALYPALCRLTAVWVSGPSAESRDCPQFAVGVERVIRADEHFCAPPSRPRNRIATCLPSRGALDHLHLGRRAWESSHAHDGSGEALRSRG